jgi:hypothetical protein
MRWVSNRLSYQFRQGPALGSLVAHHLGRDRLYRCGMNPRVSTGNWTPDGEADRAALRRDYLKLTPAQRAEQVMELSRLMSEVAAAGRRRRDRA